MNKQWLTRVLLVGGITFFGVYFSHLSLQLRADFREKTAESARMEEARGDPISLRQEQAAVGERIDFYELFHLEAEQVVLDDEKDQILLAERPQKRYIFFRERLGQDKYGKRLAIVHFIDKHPPQLLVEDTGVAFGSAFEPLSNLSAKDAVDGDLTKQIKVAGKVDTSRAGSYTLTYSVSDYSGNQTSKNRRITVAAEEPEESLYPANEEVQGAAVPAATEEAPAAVLQANPESASQGENPPVAVEAAPAPTPAPETPAYAANTLYFAGAVIPYQNGGTGSGQRIIDSNPYGVASTWGGAGVQSGSDGQNTHFIGHNPGIFSSALSLAVGSSITVTDASGTPTVYTVQGILTVDDHGNDQSTGENHWELTVGTAGGERITLQTCVSPEINRMVLAYA